MSNENETKEVLKDAVKSALGLASPRAKHFMDAFPSFMELARRIAVPIQVALAVAGLAAAVWYGLQWNRTSTTLSDRIQTSLKEKLDNTVWQHKGFAAFLLSGIDEQHSRTGPSDNPAIINRFLANVQCIERIANTEAKKKIIGSSQLQADIDALSATTPQTDTAGRVINSDEASHAEPNDCLLPSQENLKFRISGTNDGSRSHQAVMIDGGGDFLIFVPGMALHYDNDNQNPTTNYDQMNLFHNSAIRTEGQMTDGLRAALMVNPDIVRDLDLARKLSGKMKEFDNLFIDGHEVVQSYFIAESGLILIRSKDVKNQLALYEIQFPKAYYFPDRDYVWGALRGRDTEKLKPIGFDYESEPYIDLGGHGLVKTYSKKIQLANGRYGVICVDVSRAELDDKLRARLNVLRTEGDPYKEASIVIKHNSIAGPNGKGRDALPKDFQWFTDKLLEKLNQADPSETAELLGRIAAQQDISGMQDTKILRYTIPLSTKLDDEQRTVKLMMVTIDFERLWTLQNRRAIFMCVGLMIFLGVTINIFQDSFILKKQITELVQRLDRVMEHSRDPYARVNSENQFVAANKRFLNLLGYGNKDKLEHDNWGGSGVRTYMSILDEPSQQRYKEILRISRSGAATEPYSVNMYTRNNDMLRARVLSERIVFPTIRKEKYPQRFGIVLEWSAIDPAYEENLANTLDRDVRVIDSPDGDGGRFEIKFKNQEDRDSFANLLLAAASSRTQDAKVADNGGRSELEQSDQSTNTSRKASRDPSSSRATRLNKSDESD